MDVWWCWLGGAKCVVKRQISDSKQVHVESLALALTMFDTSFPNHGDHTFWCCVVSRPVGWRLLQRDVVWLGVAKMMLSKMLPE